MKKVILFSFILISLISCESIKTDANCELGDFFENVDTRIFRMGFSSWPYGPNQTDIQETYDFIHENSDIISEQLDELIPWNSLINGQDLPSTYLEGLEYKKGQLKDNQELLLSVSLLNTDRSNLLGDENGDIPVYESLDDSHIKDAYLNYLEYLIDFFNPEYLVFAMEVNDLIEKDIGKWGEYKRLSIKIIESLKVKYPQVRISASITLHNWYETEHSDQSFVDSEIETYIESLDFAAISFYPFFKGLKNRNDFMDPFDFLHDHVNKEIAFVETTHLAERLEIDTWDLDIKSDVCQQKEYLEVLLEQAQTHQYLFVIWWAYRDFDDLWEVFPADVKDIGKLWRDTGLIDENGIERVGFKSWERAFLR